MTSLVNQIFKLTQTGAKLPTPQLDKTSDYVQRGTHTMDAMNDKRLGLVLS